MIVRLRCALVCAVVCVLAMGCSSTARQPADPVNPDAPINPGGSLSPDEHAKWAKGQCAEAAARTQAVLTKSGWDDSCAGGMTHLDDLFAALDVCEVTATGVWTTELTAALPISRGAFYDQDDACLTISGDWALTFRQPNIGEPVASIERSVDFDIDDCDRFETPLAPEFFDYDGDGEPEVFYADAMGQAMCDGGDEFVHRALWTRQEPAEIWGDDRGRKIAGLVAYDITADRHFVDVRDIDEDGRPDLVIPGDLSYWEPDCAGFASAPIDPAPRLAHALPDGRFSLDDDVARGFLRESCPGEPLTPLDYYEEHGIVVFNPYLSMDMLACSKIWGASPEESVAALSTECTSFVEFDECTETPHGMSYEDMRTQKLCPVVMQELALQPVDLVLP